MSEFYDLYPGPAPMPPRKVVSRYDDKTAARQHARLLEERAFKLASEIAKSVADRLRGWSWPYRAGSLLDGLPGLPHEIFISLACFPCDGFKQTIERHRHELDKLGISHDQPLLSRVRDLPDPAGRPLTIREAHRTRMLAVMRELFERTEAEIAAEEAEAVRAQVARVLAAGSTGRT